MNHGFDGFADFWSRSMPIVLSARSFLFVSDGTDWFRISMRPETEPQRADNRHHGIESRVDEDLVVPLLEALNG